MFINAEGSDLSFRVLIDFDIIDVGIYQNEGIALIENRTNPPVWADQYFIRGNSIKEYEYEVIENDKVSGGIFAGKITGVSDLVLSGTQPPQIMEDEEFGLEFRFIIE